MKYLLGILIFLCVLKNLNKYEFIDPINIHKEEFECLVENAYYEAFSEGAMGMILVTQVVLNRAQLKQKTYCEIIYEPYQFSWTLLKKRPKIKQEDKTKVWRALSSYLVGAISIPEEFRHATHFHATYVKPYWIKHTTHLGRWKTHIFYKTEGYK